MRPIKVWLAGGLTGLGTAVSFISVQRALSHDYMFDAWEFGVAAAAPALIAIIIALATKSRLFVFLPVAYLTLVLPVLGPAFGGTGSEPLWEFGALGLVGGLVWSIPFALWALMKSRRPRSHRGSA